MSKIETMGTPTVRTSAGLRDALFDELDGLRSGTSNPAKANAVAKLAGQVIDTVKMELDVQKHLAKTPKMPVGVQASTPAVQLSQTAA